ARRARARPPRRGRTRRPDRRRTGSAARVSRRGRGRARPVDALWRQGRVAGVRPFPTLRYAKRGAVAIITLDRPEKLNAYSVAMRDDLYEALGAADEDPDVRALVLGGRGRAFSTGGDVSEFGTAPSPRVARVLDLVLSGRWLDARGARDAGIALRVVPRRRLAVSALALARRLARLEPSLVAAARRAVRAAHDLTIADGIALEGRLGTALAIELTGRSMSEARRCTRSASSPSR